MIKRFLCLGFTFTFFLNLHAQHSIKGKVIDEQGQGLGFTTIALLQPGDSILLHFGVTNDQGEYQIKGINAGTYILQFSFVGKKALTSYWKYQFLMVKI